VTGLKTYSHLAGSRRTPSEYEIVTSRLHHHVDRGFEVNVPMAAWYERHVGGSRWQAPDWERFADPRETTYTKYTRLQQAKEAYVDGLLNSIEQSGHDGNLSTEARALLERTLPPLRFAVHGLQMLAAYVGQMAPSGRITIVAALQAADEMRRIQRFAYRMAQLRRVEPAFGAQARAAFQSEACWQPLRRVVESLLVTYDWAESLVALNVCLKPALDELFMIELAAAARERGDFVLGQLLASLDEDCQWHRRWTAALVGVALAARPENRAALADWTQAWVPKVSAAIAALAPLLDEAGAGEIAPRIERHAAAFREALELEAGGASP
jgi:toluene monooxygenase system protein E